MGNAEIPETIDLSLDLTHLDETLPYFSNASLPVANEQGSSVEPLLSEVVPANGSGEVSGINFPLDPVLLAQGQTAYLSTVNQPVTNEQGYPVAPSFAYNEVSFNGGATPVAEVEGFPVTNSYGNDLLTTGGPVSPSNIGQGIINVQAYSSVPVFMANGSFGGAQRNYIPPITLKASH